MKIIAVVLAALLVGCATTKQDVVGVATSTNTFAACKGADVITTAVALNSGNFVEANPILKGLIGPHNFFPLIAFSVVAWRLLVWANEPVITGAANVATCGVAASNAWKLLK